MSNTCTFYVEGMHCAACELLIEKRLKTIENVQSCKASLKNSELKIAYTDSKPTIDSLNEAVKEFGYKFHTSAEKIKQKKTQTLKQALVLALLILGGFTLLEKTGIASAVSITDSSPVMSFFAFGLVAGISSCAALVGGLLLSVSKNWNDKYVGENISTRSMPFIMFNLGRLVSFTLLGGILGLIGSVLKLSLSFTSAVALLISGVMVLLGLQMLGVKWASKFVIRLPKSITGKITDESKFSGKYMPATLGALTFFAPCGFTLVAQSLALASGSFVRGSSYMLAFSLGTLPMLTIISATSLRVNAKPGLTQKFNYLVGFLILFFGVYNFNSQLNVLGFKSLSDIKIAKAEKKERQQSTSQLIQIEAYGYSYYPRYFAVKAGLPVKMEILNTGAAGCANAVVARGLINRIIYLQKGLNTVEFTPKYPGEYKLTCTMGMVPPVSIKVI